MNDIKELTIKELLGSDEYRIPIYQRNYAWGIGEATQLIQDIADYAKDNPNSNYYIGNLIVFPRYNDHQPYYETIDGQQRTTTLTILLCVLKHQYSDYDFSWYGKTNISFDHREKSNYTLSILFDNPDKTYHSSLNTDILSIYNKAMSTVDKTCQDKGLPIVDFINYLLHNVIILRICVPKDTNLNHYFEIMNSRGEQLEQHEIVKATLMSPIKDDDAAMVAFNMIWEACSNMDRYVQLNFPKKIRETLFTNHGTGEIAISFDELKEQLRNQELFASDKDEKSLENLFADSDNNIPYKRPWDENTDKDLSESYHSLITFSNFLLHVLKILYPQNDEIVLDDKRLNKIFRLAVDNSSDKTDFTINFIMALLEIRFFFDKYIIKRKQDKWSLKKLVTQKDDDNRYYYTDTFPSSDQKKEANREIVMLLSMFHVSAPTQIYKHWMNACLFFVHNNPNVSDEEYKGYIWKLAKTYMLDRYLASADSKIPFETIIYEKMGENTHTIEDVSWANINIDEYPQRGEQVENFVFNFYDYLLWQQSKDVDFEFTYRTSVEHFYPQHPTDRKPMDFNHLHSFGNLCLISRGINSKFTNNLPGAKYENFGNSETMKTYSLKLQAMMNCIKDGETWDETNIADREQEAKDLISEVLSSK